MNPTVTRGTDFKSVLPETSGTDLKSMPPAASRTDLKSVLQAANPEMSIDDPRVIQADLSGAREILSRI